MAAQITGEVTMEMCGSAAEIGLDVATKLLRPVVIGAKTQGMPDNDMGALMVGMLAGVCANYAGVLALSEIQQRLQECVALMARAPDMEMTGNVPMPGTVQ